MENDSVLTQTIAKAIGSFSFCSLLILIVLVATPYGGAEPWWKALFQCVVFALAALCVIERLLWKSPATCDYSLLFPAFALIAFAFLQTLAWSHQTTAGIDNIPRTVSADPSQTRLFISQFTALVLAGWLLVVHTNSRRRLRLLVEVIIAIGLISAGFGLLRQATQESTGFFLPYLRPHFGYAQFINANHFAFLMEMALGMLFGIVVCRGVSGRRLAIYLMAAIPMCLALILANSRGGILSFLCQVVFLGILFGSGRPSQQSGAPARASGSWLLRTARTAAVRAILVSVLLSAALVTIIFVGGEPLARKLSSASVELEQVPVDEEVRPYLRINIWPPTWTLIRDKPIAGIGFGAYWIAITKYHRSSGKVTPQEAHSDYLELLASGGLIGLAIGIWFVVAFVRTVRRKLLAADQYNRAVTLGALTGILAVAVHSLVDYGLHITVNTLLLTALVSMVVINVKDKERVVKAVK